MATHLDTNFLIRGVRTGTAEYATLRAWVRDARPLAVAAPAWTEFLNGPLASADIAAAEKLFGQILPFTAREAPLAAQLFNAAGRRRGSLVDCMIAATAITAQAELATANVADFERFVPLGLRLAG